LYQLSVFFFNRIIQSVSSTTDTAQGNRTTTRKSNADNTFAKFIHEKPEMNFYVLKIGTPAKIRQGIVAKPCTVIKVWEIIAKTKTIK